MVLAKTQRRDRAILHAAAQARLPVVSVAPDERLPDVQVLHCNNIEAGILIADHLVDLGHTRIAFVSGPAHSIDSKHRLRGVREGLVRRRLRLDPALVYSCGSWALEAGTTFAQALLGRPLPMTAIIFANDALALGFLRVAHERGVRVPQDVSVAGFDGLPQGAIAWPSLTTVAQPIRDMGRVACRRLFEAIAVPGSVEQIQFRMTLVPRESTGAAAAGAAQARLQPVVRTGSGVAGE
jgi:LacI family transcriptional regulator